MRKLLLTILLVSGCKSSTATSPMDLSTPADLEMAPQQDAAPPDLAPGKPTALAFVSPPPSCATDTALPTLVVDVVDAQGTRVALDSGTVTLSLQAASGAKLAVFQSASTTISQTVNASGEVQFNGLYIDLPGQGYTITASYGGQRATLSPATTTFDCHTAWTASATQPSASPAPKYYPAILVPANDSNTIYAGSDNGLFKSSNAGATWSTQVPGGPAITYVRQLVTDPNNRVYVQNYPNFYRQASGDSSWASLSWPGYMIAFPAVGNEIYTLGGGASQWQWSNNDGANWTTATYSVSLPPDDQSWLLDPTTSGTSAVLYMVGNTDPGPLSAMFSSVDRGQNWSPVSPCTSQSHVSAAVGTDGTLFASCGSTYRSTDHGAHWTQATFTGFVNPPSPFSFSFHPTNHSVMYAWAAGGGAFRSADGGLTFSNAGFLTNASGNLTSLAVDPANVNVVWVGVPGRGIFKTTTGGL